MHFYYSPFSLENVCSTYFYTPPRLRQSHQYNLFDCHTRNQDLYIHHYDIDTHDYHTWIGQAVQVSLFYKSKH